MSNRKIGNILIVALLFVTISCGKEDIGLARLVGKWQLVKGFDLMVGGYYEIDPEYRRIEEYTTRGVKIQYDYLEREISRCQYRTTDTTIILFGEEVSGTRWEFETKYWFLGDTLALHHDGGFEFYNEFFIRLK